MMKLGIAQVCFVGSFIVSFRNSDDAGTKYARCWKNNCHAFEGQQCFESFCVFFQNEFMKWRLGDYLLIIFFQNGSRSKMKQRAVGGKQSRDSKMLEFPEFEATLTKALEDVKPIQNRSHLLIRILEKMSVTRKQLVDRIAEALIAMPSIFRDETLSQILEMFASKSTTKWDQDTLL